MNKFHKDRYPSYQKLKLKQNFCWSLKRS